MTNRRRKRPHKWNAVNETSKPCGLRIWWEAVKAQGWKVVIRRPHHYVVSFGISAALWYIGAHSPAEHTTAWLYAVLENVSTVLDE